MSFTATSPDSLRRLIRELIAELAPGMRSSAGAPNPTTVEDAPQSESSLATAAVPVQLSSSNPPSAVSPNSSPDRFPDVIVSVSTDTELAGLVDRIQRLYDDPSTRSDLQAGRIRFRLATAESADLVPVNGRARHRLTKLLVTERDVAAAHQAQVTLLVSSRAVVTPLARDKAKALHVVIEKDR
ncbi:MULTISPECIES: hypothetical protein [unclassified Mycolicibacterium]|uniref:hypothetical protein n=1 Tax=unclassified Mycolicibacterium TaxID=2636767 RepID=UPI0012DCB645|nr:MULTISPECIES: hypothetical protein [unclassified Mycolicibacterium]MUM03962.1 hypothetical protein [Mycolicibacterium sp. CBMA 213]